jgi:hypothetical protein
MKIKLISIFSLGLLALALQLNAAEIYVSAKGNDSNLGTKAQPLATLHAAIRKARELRRLNNPSIKSGIRILMNGGVYSIHEPIILHPEDSGTKDSPTQIIDAGTGKVIISGGIQVKNWKKITQNVPGLTKKAIGKVWVANAPKMAGRIQEFRQLWVNNQKAVRARTKNGELMDRISSWDFKKETCRIANDKLIDFKALAGVEMTIHQWWAIANLRVKSAQLVGNLVELSFMQPESRIQSEHPWPSPWLSTETGNSAYFLSNSIQFLDQPGEWYEDLTNGKIYYWPLPNENPTSSEIVAPLMETLVKMEGTIDQPIAYVNWNNISFQHTTWLRPSKMGHVPLQTGMFLLDAYKLKVPGTPDKALLENQAWVGRPAAAVEVKYALNTNFEACSFEHLGSTGLDYQKGTQNSRISGNLFKDIGGSGILIGTFSDEGLEAHLPYQPKDVREISTNDKLENNLITDVTNEDWGCVGIGAGYVKGIQILHNEVNEVSYTGISLGWGWTTTRNAMENNVIKANKIHHYGKRMYDVAGIYTLSAQPNSIIEENVVDSIYKASYAHLPDHWFYIYTDEGTSNFTIQRNWTPSQKYLQNANGPGNIWQNNGNLVSDIIKQNAGLEPRYRQLLKYNAKSSAAQAINLADQAVVFEIVFSTKEKNNINDVKSFCISNHITLSSIYQWENRTIIYTRTKTPITLQQTLKDKLKATVNLYDNIFYNFQRSKNCQQETAKEWEHVILSANLVKDEKMQQEYLSAHATQFDKWPELSQGFCNAEFQQLVIYRNGRQLMLIISIPKGKTLDELNPKTTANNPRVNEWNELMKKYQEGIPGTKPGEVWVFFERLTKD